MAGAATAGGREPGAAAATAGTAAPDGVVLRTRGLTKHYDGHVAVDGLDLEVRAGEIFGLLGPNGAGKTTTILMLLGLTEPTGGEARVLGLDPMRHPLEVKSRVGYLPDDVGFYGAMTGRQNLRYTARLNGLAGAEAEDRLDALLAEVGLAGAADRRVDTYSRGMRQRLGIADALVADPEVVILDEPTIAIDPQGVAEILAIVRSLATDRGAAVLLSSHLLHQVQSICDRVGIFVDGRMVAEGRMAELAERLVSGLARVEIRVAPVPRSGRGAAAGTRHETAVPRSGRGAAAGTRHETAVPGSGRGAAAGTRHETAVNALGAVDGVERVEADEREPGRLLVHTRAEAVPALAGALADAGVGVTHLRRLDTELDELYRRYFAEEEVSGGGG